MQNRLGRRLIDGGVLNSIIVLMVATTVLVPMRTERFCLRIVQKTNGLNV